MKPNSDIQLCHKQNDSRADSTEHNLNTPVHHTS